MSTVTATFDETLGVLGEVGKAWRGDWSVDGRSGRLILDSLANSLRQAHENGGRANRTVAQLRDDADVCAHGLGHWTDHCDEKCADRAAERAWDGETP